MLNQIPADSGIPRFCQISSRSKDAAANVAAIRRMIAQSNTWKRIQELDTKPQSAAKTHVGSNIE
jgi:hypothetical protein